MVSTSSVSYHVERTASCFFEPGKPKDEDGTICAPSPQACEFLRNTRQRLPSVGDITECEIVDLGDLAWHRQSGGFIAILVAVGGGLIGLVAFVPTVQYWRRRRRRRRDFDRWN
jgi:hypothetical protein